jgi:signal transduction histidine kinase
MANLDLAEQELGRISSMTQQTLGFYRDNSCPLRFRVADAIKEVLAIYDRKIRYKRLNVRIDVPLEFEIFAPQGELKQVIANLIANAVDASREQGTICVKAHCSHDWRNTQQRGLAITVADNGCGMSPEVQQQIFTPFFTTKQRVGTGLGLWTTQNMVSRQGGFVRVRSRQGAKSWTIMSIFLPFRSEISSEIQPTP